MFIGLGIVVILWVGRRKLVTQSSRHLRDEFGKISRNLRNIMFNLI